MQKITSIGEILFDVYPNNKKLGGAPFNFIYHIIKLTGSGNFISRVGDDKFGNEIMHFLKLQNISTDFIQIDKEHPTGIAKPELNNDKIPQWVIEENTAYDFIERNRNNNELIESGTNCLYFGTLAQRGKKSRETIHSFFNRKNLKYFCDLNIRQKFYNKEIIEASLLNTDLLKLNIDELKLVNDLLLKEKFEAEKISNILMDNYAIDLVCVTSGSEGAVLLRDHEINQYKIKVDNIVDTVGAGDAYAAMLCIGYLNNWSLKRINKTACEFSAEIVKINGALPEDESIYGNFKKKILNEK